MLFLLDETPLDAQTSICKILPAVVSDLLVPNSARALALVPGDNCSAFRRGVDSNSTVLIVNLQLATRNLVRQNPSFPTCVPDSAHLFIFFQRMRQGKNALRPVQVDFTQVF